MGYLLIRDDDVSAFTTPALLETLYAPLFERGLPVNFAVIPNLATDVPLGFRSVTPMARLGLEWEPFIPPAVRGRREEHDIRENPRVIELLRSVGAEVLQHGIHHAWPGHAEFAHGMEPVAALEARVRRGRDILADAFGAAPRFFVPPWDFIDRGPLAAVRNAGFDGVSMARLGRNLPRMLWPQLAARRATGRDHMSWWGAFLMLAHQGYVSFLFDMVPQEAIAASLARNGFAIVVAHHWEADFDWTGTPEPTRLQRWHSFLSRFLGDPSVQVISFSTLHDALAGRRLATEEAGTQAGVHRAT